MIRAGSPNPPGTRLSPAFALRLAAIAAWMVSPLRADDPPAAVPPSPPAAPVSAPGVAEATERARLLHAALSGALQVMHRDFFRRGNDSRHIPSSSLEDVFREMKSEAKVTLRWLAPDDVVQNEDNRARDDFEKAALAALGTGRAEFSMVENGTLRFAGPVLLHNSCLRCHVPGRKSLEDRFAALSIAIPVSGASPAEPADRGTPSGSQPD